MIWGRGGPPIGPERWRCTVHTHVRLTAALLIPVLALGPSCVRAPRQVRLELDQREVIIALQDAPVVEVSEVDFHHALARLSQDPEMIAFFNRPASPRLRLMPASFTQEDPFVSGYRQLCAARGKPTDCLELLQDGVFDADDRQSVATSIAFRSV